MKKIISALVSAAIVYYLGGFLLDILLAHDLLTHFNECHEELNLKDRINAPMSDSEIDVLYEQWGACVKQKENFIDKIFSSKLAEKSMDAMKEDRKKKGPYNERESAHTTDDTR